jgi:hypothetical protein
LGQFGDDEVLAVATLLDEKMSALAESVVRKDA